MDRVFVGCPLRGRSHIINRWAEYVDCSFQKAGFSPAFVFVGAQDDPTRSMISFDHKWVDSGEIYIPYQREWNLSRFQEMSNLRNLLLDNVNGWFLSLDSDIFMHEDQMSVLASLTEAFDVVGGKVYLSPRGKFHPSYAMMKRNGNMRRPDSEGTFRVDAVMAIKLMSPDVVANVRYSAHSLGEDFGFSQNARNMGYKLGWTGAVCSKHLFSPGDEDRIDKRCGF